MSDQKNTILAIVLSALVLIVWQVFYGMPHMEKQKQIQQQQAVQRAPAGGHVTSGLVCPVRGAVSFVDSWGAPRGDTGPHQGVDMMAARGTPDVAVVSGTVQRFLKITDVPARQPAA